MNKILRSILSTRATIILMIIYALLLALATFVEAKMGTPTALSAIYHNPLFIFLQAVMIVNFVAVTRKMNLVGQRKWGVLISHYGFVMALVGAMVTHIWGSEYMLYVREGASSSVGYGQTLELNYTIDSKEYSTPLDERTIYSQTHDGVTVMLDNYCKGCGAAGSDVASVSIAVGGDSQKVMLSGMSRRPAQYQALKIGDKVISIGFGAQEQELPFSVTLKDFVIERYGGSGSPSSFESFVTIDNQGKKSDHHIFMNNIAYVGGYRLYQTSYDPDEMGTILTVNHDLAGMIISYIGYIMMLLGFVVGLFHKSSRFRILLARLSRVSTVVALMFLASGELSANSYTNIEQLKSSVMPQELSQKMARLLVQNPNGRIEPLGSYTDKLVMKIYRSSSYEGIGSVDIVASMISEPYRWSNAPMIYLSGADLEARFGGKEYVSFNELFDSQGNYLLTPDLEKISPKDPSSLSKTEKDILKLDEKINIMNLLFRGSLLNLFPLNSSVDGHWYSSGDDTSQFSGRDSLFVTSIMPWFAQENLASYNSGDWAKPLEIIGMIDTYQQKMAKKEHLIPSNKVEAELLYNKVNIFKISGISYLASAFVLLVLLFSSMGAGRGRALTFVAIAVIAAAFVCHTSGIGLRWYFSGRSPWTNSYESMIFISWSAVLAGLLFTRKSKAALGVAVMMGGIVAMISQLNFLDPQITPLVPVLKSYWLMFHVAIITASYGFFGVCTLLGIISMIIIISKPSQKLKQKIEELTIINEISMIIGVILLTIGIFIGAVWANESWGRYWGWDPKETWALISMVVYATVLHLRFVKELSSRFLFIVASVWSFYVILMTFFGVNYYLSGMHSYTEGSSLSGIYVILPTIALLILTIFAYIRREKQ